MVKKKRGWFIGKMAACFFLRLTYRRDRPCRDPLKRDSVRYAITLINQRNRPIKPARLFVFCFSLDETKYVPLNPARPLLPQ